MNVLLIKEVNRDARRKSEPTYAALIVEDNGTEDGGRMIARVFRYEDAVAIVRAMWWKITSNEFEE